MNYDEMKTGESAKINVEAAKPITNNSTPVSYTHLCV